jgi:RNA polymerase sigma-70 factor (subfamily 1)
VHVVISKRRNGIAILLERCFAWDMLSFKHFLLSRRREKFSMASTNDESSLISKAVAGNLAAMEVLLHRHRKPLIAYVRQHFPEALRFSTEPDDIVQDVWLRAIRNFSVFRGNTFRMVYGWLVAIARTVIADQLKSFRAAKRKGTRHLLDDVVVDGSGEDSSIIRLLKEMALYQRTPSKSAASHELMAALDGAISRLPADQAEAVRLRYLTGLEIQEIADKMRRTVPSVWMLCNRALKSLRWEMRSVSLYI